MELVNTPFTKKVFNNPENVTSALRFTVTPLGIVMFCEVTVEEGTAPPQVNELFQSPDATAVNCALESVEKHIPNAKVNTASLPCTVQTPAEIAHQELFKLHVELARLRYLRSHQAVTAEVLMALTKSLDAAFKRWAASVPDEYAFTTVPAMLGQDTVNGIYYVYPSLGIARVWDIYRMGRLLNAESMGRQAAVASSPVAKDDLDTARRLQLDLCADICNSMAFYLLNPNAKAIIGTTIVWPLYTVATIDGVTVEMRLWVLRQMRDIAVRTAAMQGIQFSEVLSKQWDVTIWDRKTGIDDDSGQW